MIDRIANKQHQQHVSSFLSIYITASTLIIIIILLLTVTSSDLQSYVMSSRNLHSWMRTSCTTFKHRYYRANLLCCLSTSLGTDDDTKRLSDGSSSPPFKRSPVFSRIPYIETYKSTATAVSSKFSFFVSNMKDRKSLDLIAYVRARDYDKCMQAYDEMKLEDTPNREKSFLVLLSLCHKAEHLSKAHEIVEDMLRFNISHSETSYIALVRCYANAGQTDKALSLIDELILDGIELKPRIFQPVLDEYSNNGDVYKLLEQLKRMNRLNVTLRDDPITALLLSLGCKNSDDAVNNKIKAALRDPSVIEAINELLFDAANKLLGLSTLSMQKIVMKLNNLTSSEVIDQGILVESLDDIRSQVIHSQKDDGSVIALNASFERSISILDGTLPSSQTYNPSIPVGQDYANVQLLPEKYVISSERKKLLDKLSQQRINNSSGSDASDGDGDVINSEYMTSMTKQIARMVDISNKSCRCPNCNGELRPLLISEEEKRRVRIALHKIVSSRSNDQRQALIEFEEWLKERPEYEYIVDAANVAYNNQNFESGKFSYQQIELVVDKLKERSKNILVIIPNSYASQTSIPNSISKGGKKSKRSTLSANDQRIIDKLRDGNMLYVVPRGANDDWYWVYATIYEGRKKPAYVISNDLMRDHKIAFIEPKPFLRWRSSQIVYFALSKVCEDSDDVSYNGSGNNTSTRAMSGSDEGNSSSNSSSDMDRLQPPEVYLYEPGEVDINDRMVVLCSMMHDCG